MFERGTPSGFWGQSCKQRRKSIVSASTELCLSMAKPFNLRCRSRYLMISSRVVRKPCNETPFFDACSVAPSHSRNSGPNSERRCNSALYSKSRKLAYAPHPVLAKISKFAAWASNNSCSRSLSKSVMLWFLRRNNYVAFIINESNTQIDVHIRTAWARAHCCTGRLS